MTARSSTATTQPVARIRAEPRLDRTRGRRARASFDCHRRVERDAASLEAVSVPAALIGVHFN